MMSDAPVSRSEEIALLRAAIDRSGLSVTAFARTVLVRDIRTVQRWLSGDRQIPKAVLDLLQRERVA